MLAMLQKKQGKQKLTNNKAKKGKLGKEQGNKERKKGKERKKETEDKLRNRRQAKKEKTS